MQLIWNTLHKTAVTTIIILEPFRPQLMAQYGRELLSTSLSVYKVGVKVARSSSVPEIPESISPRLC